MKKKIDDIFNRLDTVHQRNRRTDGRTDGQTDGRTPDESKDSAYAQRHAVKSVFL